MKTIASTLLLFLIMGNVWSQSVTGTPNMHTEEFRNYHNALQHYSYAVLENLHSESEQILFKHRPDISLTGNAAKAKLLRTLCILDAIQKETEEYFFNQPPGYTYCTLGKIVDASTN